MHGNIGRGGTENLEDAENLTEITCLTMQRFCGSCSLLNQSRILLRHFVHARDGLVDLFDAGSLLFAGCSDFAHDVGHAFDALDYFAHGGACLVDQSTASIDFFH